MTLCWPEGAYGQQHDLRKGHNLLLHLLSLLLHFILQMQLTYKSYLPVALSTSVEADSRRSPLEVM